MAIKVNDNVEIGANFTPADSNYQYGSAKNESSPGANDGTPYAKSRADDIFGAQQALLRAAGITPTGNAETALASQYLQSTNQLASGRSFLYNETGTANAKVLELRSNQQSPGGYFNGMRLAFVANATNTGSVTLDSSVVTGDPAGTKILPIRRPGGSVNMSSGDILADTEYTVIYRTSPVEHFELASLNRASQTAINNGTGEFDYVTPARMRFGVFYSLSAPSGYIIFPSWLGSLKIMWLNVAESANSSSPISWPISFSSTVFCAVGSTSEGINNNVSFDSVTRFDFLMRCDSNYGNATKAYVLGIGV